MITIDTFSTSVSAVFSTRVSFTLNSESRTFGRRTFWPMDIWLVGVTFGDVGQLATDIFMCYSSRALNEITFVNIASVV